MENNNCHILEIINKILLLQGQNFSDDLVGCEKPFLGPSTPSSTYNTRPVILYNKYTATPWTFQDVSGTTTDEYNVVRLEDIDHNSITVRLLAFNTETSEYTNTNQFVTIDLNTIGAIRCLADTYISL